MPLSKKYGKPSIEHNQLNEGSIWHEPRHWMMSILKDERNLQAYLERKGLPDNLLSILISASADGTNEGKIGVFYTFNNHEQCDAESHLITDTAL